MAATFMVKNLVVAPVYPSGRKYFLAGEDVIVQVKYDAYIMSTALVLNYWHTQVFFTDAKGNKIPLVSNGTYPSYGGINQDGVTWDHEFGAGGLPVSATQLGQNPILDLGPMQISGTGSTGTNQITVHVQGA